MQNRKILIIIDNVQRGGKCLDCNEQGKPGGGGQGRGRGRGRGRPGLGGTRVREGFWGKEDKCQGVARQGQGYGYKKWTQHQSPW